MQTGITPTGAFHLPGSECALARTPLVPIHVRKMMADHPPGMFFPSDLPDIGDERRAAR